MKEKLFFFKEG